MQTWYGLGGQVLKANIFERRTFLLMWQKKVISTLDLTTYQTVGALNSFLQEMKASFIHKGPGLLL